VLSLTVAEFAESLLKLSDIMSAWLPQSVRSLISTESVICINLMTACEMIYVASHRHL